MPPTALSGWRSVLDLDPELSQVMIKVEVGVAHALGPGHLPKHGVRRKFTFPGTETPKQTAEFLQVGCKVHGGRATLLLVHFRARLEAVRPPNWNPEASGFRIVRMNRLCAGLTYLSPSADARHRSDDKSSDGPTWFPTCGARPGGGWPSGSALQFRSRTLSRVFILDCHFTRRKSERLCFRSLLESRIHGYDCSD